MRQDVHSRRALLTVLALIVIAFFGALVEGCGGALQLASRWNEYTLRIDGEKSH